MVTTTETIVREDPYTEAYKRGLFESVFGLVNQQMGFEQVPTGQTDAAGNPIYENRPIVDPETGQAIGPAYAPTYQVAGRTPYQQQARDLLQENLGAYMPYIQGGLGTIQRGQGLYEQAAQLAGGTRGDPYKYQEQGSKAIQGGMDLFQPGTLEDPTSGISAFFNPYEDAVVGQVQQDFDQARRLSDMNQAASAVGSGAYGGSRAAIAEQEARRNLNREELNALGQLRQTGYTQALDAASQAQEAQQRRALTGGSYLGNLGSTFGQLGQRDVELLGSLGQGISGLGVQEADLGRTATNLLRGDISALSGFGGQEQMLQQNVLDAMRQTNVERQQLPFQSYGYLSDVLNRVPTNESTMKTNTSPQQSGLGQAIGYGIAGLGALAGVA
jgi:hypothetical protein